MIRVVAFFRRRRAAHRDEIEVIADVYDYAADLMLRAEQAHRLMDDLEGRAGG